MGQISYTLENHVARITLNRPERHNALVPELLQDLASALARCREDAPAAMILTATGTSFSTGGDVTGFHQNHRDQRRQYAASVVGGLNRVILDLITLPMPTLAVVEGMVTGGSVGLVLACDIAIAGPKASFAPWYTVVGFSPDGGWTCLLPERIGRARALDIQLTNRTVEAQEAHRTGLVQYLCNTGDGLATAQSLANGIRQRKPGSLGRTLTLTRPDPGQTAAGLDAEYRHFLEQISSDEADRGMAEFLGRPA
jgi:2-(1,2-epoxy-1,2-dihydrophenyl)acetyl-CoA isomerase